MPSRRRTWFLIRITIYLVVLAILLIYRGGVPWKRLVAHLKTPTQPAASTLVVSGSDLAPGLINQLLADYGQDYPDLTIEIKGGSTNQALEDLINSQADVAFLYRLPSPLEQTLFQQVTGDTAIVTPIAIGAILVAATAGDGTRSLTPAQLDTALAGRLPGLRRIFMSDPNEGLWDVLRENLNLTEDLPPAGSPVVFLPDSVEVLAAVATAAAADERGVWGLVSSLVLPQGAETAPPQGVRFLPSRVSTDSLPAEPTYENVATGRYPLHHVLWVACRSTGDPEGGRFVTHMAAGRGLRQVERAGVVPARAMLREIYLSRKPLGK